MQNKEYKYRDTMLLKESSELNYFNQFQDGVYVTLFPSSRLEKVMDTFWLIFKHYGKEKQNIWSCLCISL